MRPRLLLVPLCALVLLATGGARAAAEADEYPLREIDRPGSLLRGMWRLDLGVLLERDPERLASAAIAGFGAGLGRGFEAGAQVFALDLAPRPRLTAPSAYLAWATALSPRLGLEPAVRLVLPVGNPALLEVSAEAKYRLRAWLEPGVTAGYAVSLQSVLGATLAASAALKLQLSDRLFLSPTAGVLLQRRSERYLIEHADDPFAFDAAAALLGLEAGLSLGGSSGRLLDLILRWQWPRLFALSGPEVPGLGGWEWRLELKLTAGRR